MEDQLLFPETFARQGYLLFDKLFDPTLIDAVRDEYLGQYPRFEPGRLPLHREVGDRRLHLPVILKGRFLDPDLLANPILIGVLGILFGSPFLIDSVNCVTALPGAQPQHEHRDHGLLFDQVPGLATTLPPYAITVGIPLIDLDAATGTTKLFPGSMATRHGADGSPPAFSEEVTPLLKRGGCFLWDYRLWHGGMANHSARDRPILYVTYACEWFTDVINFEKHSRLPVDARDLARIPFEHRALFRRVAAKGLHDLTVAELMELQ